MQQKLPMKSKKKITDPKLDVSVTEGHDQKVKYTHTKNRLKHGWYCNLHKYWKVHKSKIYWSMYKMHILYLYLI